MTYQTIPDRTADLNSTQDINQLNDNFEAVLTHRSLVYSANLTIDWSLSTKVKVILGGNCVLSFTSPPMATTLILVITQDGNGSRTVTWPSGIKWVNREVPVLSTAANYTDIVSLYYDGVSYYGMASLNFG